MRTSESRKRQSEHDEAMLAEADRLAVDGKILAALQRVYPTAEWLEGSALRDALEDEGLLCPSHQEAAAERAHWWMQGAKAERHEIEKAVVRLWERVRSEPGALTLTPGQRRHLTGRDAS